jgi:hypothetical protein
VGTSGPVSAHTAPEAADGIVPISRPDLRRLVRSASAENRSFRALFRIMADAPIAQPVIFSVGLRNPCRRHGWTETHSVTCEPGFSTAPGIGRWADTVSGGV